MLEYFEKLCIFSSTRSLYSGKLQSVRSIALLRPSFAFIICLVLKPKLWKAYFFISSSDQMHLPGAAGFFCGRPFSEWGPAVRVYWKWSKEEMLLTQRFVVSLAIFFANCTFLTFCVFFPTYFIPTVNACWAKAYHSNIQANHLIGVWCFSFFRWMPGYGPSSDAIDVFMNLFTHLYDSNTKFISHWLVEHKAKKCFIQHITG